MIDKFYTFTVPVRGDEIVTVKANDLEEAKLKYIQGDYVEHTFDDMDVDIGYGCNIMDYLNDCVSFDKDEVEDVDKK